MYYTILSKRGLLCLSGRETLSFLQGLVTNDVLHIVRKRIVYAALLTPQGKFLHDFFLINRDDDVLIDCEKSRIADLLKRLNMYRLRSEVSITQLPDTEGVTVVWGQAVLPAAEKNILVFADPRLPELGHRIIGDVNACVAWCAEQGMEKSDEQAYDHLRLRAGVPDGSRDMAIEKSTLLPFGFDRLNGVDFTKGCYIGQEVTARTKHIAQRKKQLYRVRVIKGELPAYGTTIYFGAEEAGELCSHLDGLGLALLKLDMAEQAQALKADFRCGEATLHAELPGWAKV